MIPDRYAPATYALFRIIFGFVFLVFGLQKTLGLFGGTQVGDFMTMQGAAGIIETVGGLLIMIGLFTKPAAFIASGEMAVAFFYIHVYMLAKAPLPMGLVPQLNNGVDAALFSVAFLYIATRGAGMLSLDGLRSKSGRR